MKKLLYTLLAVSIIFSACEKEEEETSNTGNNNTGNNTNLAIGDTYQGGIIFYLDGNGGGLIAAATETPAKVWGCHGYLVQGHYGGDDGLGIGWGMQNTIAASECWEAPIFCLNLSLQGYDDWFLPSVNELSLMYHNIGADGVGWGNIGNFEGRYWSSDEMDENNALSIDFSDYHHDWWPKNAELNVRPIRAF
jgi:hypothetical protein